MHRNRDAEGYAILDTDTKQAAAYVTMRRALSVCCLAPNDAAERVQQLFVCRFGAKKANHRNSCVTRSRRQKARAVNENRDRIESEYAENGQRALLLAPKRG